MRSIKTAISIQESLFEQAEHLARKMKVSRSRLFVLALEDYISHQQNRELLAQINAAHADKPDLPEKAFHRKMKRVHRQMVQGEW